MSVQGNEHGPNIRALLSTQDEWRWVTMNAAAGVPGGRVAAMEIDGDGSVWVGATQGLVWFDGYQFLSPVVDGERKTIRDPIEILRRSNGEIAVLAGEALYAGRKGILRRLPTPGPLAGLAELHDGGLYGVTPLGHYRLAANVWKPVRPPAAVNQIFPGSAGRPWLVTGDSGILRWGAAEWESAPPIPGFYGLNCLAENGGVLAASVRAPATRYGTWEWNLSSRAPGRQISHDLARTITLAPNGDGIATFESGDVQVRVDGNWVSLDNNYNSSMLRRAGEVILHPNGEIWAGVDGAILVFRAQTDAAKHRLFTPGDRRNIVHEFFRRRNGELWAGTSDGLIVQDAGGDWRSLDQINGKRLGIVTGLSEDSEGSLWVSSGSSFGGAYRLMAGKWQEFRAGDGLTDWPIHRIRRDRKGRLWFLTNYSALKGRPEAAGAYVWDGRKFRRLRKPDALPDLRLYSMTEAPDGAVWFASWNGLLRLDGDEWEQYPLRDSPPPLRTFDVAAAPDGSIWFCHQRGSRGVGRLRRISSQKAEVHYFQQADGLPGNDVWAVQAEPDGRIWAATGNGVGVFHGGPWVAAGNGLGMEGIKTWGLFLDKDHIWFGTLGQGVFRLSRRESLQAEPRVFFLNPVTSGDVWTIGWQTLARGGAMRPGEILNRFRVDGSDWTPWTTKREWETSQAGEHTIEVQTVGALGDVNAAPAVFRFRVPYPFYRRPGVIAAVTLLLLGMSAGILHYLRSRARYTRELEIAKRKAEESGKARAAFLAMMSHEIRTPMNGVLGMTTLMLETPLDHQQRGYVETIKKSADALLAVINDVLDISKIESQAFQIIDAPFDAEEICEQVATILSTRAEEKSLLLFVDYPSSLPPIVIGDGGRFRQILLNLAGNAVKFTDAGVVGISVSQASRTGQSIRLRFSVRDTGIGIPAESVSRLFEEFQQVDSTDVRRHGGTGLGLAISRKLASRMGGSLTVESTPGTGSTFVCELPFTVAEPVRNPVPIPGRCLLDLDEPELRQNVFAMARDIGMECELGPASHPIPAGMFRFVITDPARSAEVAGRVNDSSTKVIAASYRSRSEAPALLPLSRLRLRSLAAPATGAVPSEKGTAVAVPFAGHLLVVEDNLTNQRVISLLLEKLGCRVTLAADGEQAVRLCGSQDFDLIFMDMQMPVMDGLEATRRIRRTENGGRQTPILALTANVLEEDRQRCLLAGMTGYLSKPLVREDLIAALRQHLPASRDSGIPLL